MVPARTPRKPGNIGAQKNTKNIVPRDLDRFHKHTKIGKPYSNGQV